MFCPHGRFVPMDVLSPWTYRPLDVLSDGRFVPMDVLSDRRFVATDVLSPRTFCPYGRFVHGRFVSGRFVWAPNPLYKSELTTLFLSWAIPS
jgi:hypothetical protein